MEFVLIIKAFVIWLIILLLAISNGAFREAVLIPKMGQKTGLILSGLLLCLLIVITSYLTVPWFKVWQSYQLLLIGIGWLLLTLVFEFSFGLLRGVTLKEILKAYSMKGGNLWPLVLLVTALAPWLTGWLRAWLSL